MEQADADAGLLPSPMEKRRRQAGSAATEEKGRRRARACTGSARSLTRIAGPVQR